MKRVVKVYPMFEDTMYTLSALNDWVTALSSIGWGLFSFGAATWMGVLLSGEGADAVARMAGMFVGSITMLLSFIAFYGARHFAGERTDKMSEFKEQCEINT